jgi:hypothetical protein
MLTAREQVAIYVDRGSGRWVVCDADGSFWVLPPTDHPWDDHQPFHPDEDADLEAVPGHYRYMLRLPVD